MWHGCCFHWGTMRITSDMNMRMMSSMLRTHQQSQYDTRLQMSSGRKVNLASDDPGAYEAIRNLTSDLSQLEQFQRNMNMATHYLSMADQGIERSYNILHQVNELAVQASDGTVDPGTLQNMAEQANQLLESMIGAANSSEGGRYTFAGLRTDVRPYEAQVDANGLITGVTYVGSEETRRIQMGPDQFAETNIAGSSPAGEGGIFQTATRDVFDSIIRLRDALLAGENPANTDIGEQLEADLGHMLNQASLNGARHEQVTLQKSYVSDMQLTHMQSLESLQSVDMAEAAMRLSQSETAYQAALYSSSNLMKQATLLNYI
ncbi:MAG TPA: flagellar hook-associated protein 3 [Verrucomicrobia bacterium]|nr:flagellar hook-associated protein 3 [Verrucomicrobiota bacterium]